MFQHHAEQCGDGVEKQHVHREFRLSAGRALRHISEFETRIHKRIEHREQLIQRAGALVFELASIKQNGVRESDSDALALYLQIMGWCEDKNALLHALLNVDETGRNWEARLGDLKCAAVSGSALAEQFVFLSAQLNLKQSKLPS